MVGASNRTEIGKSVRYAFFRQQLAQTFFKMRAELLQPTETRAIIEFSELRQASRHRQRISAQRPSLINRANRRQHIHHLRPATEGTDG